MTCISNKTDGNKCTAEAMNGSQYCYFHNPDISGEEKKAAQSKGGRARSVRVKTPLPPMNVGHIDDVVFLLEDTVNLLRAGEVDVKYANCIGVLSGQLIKALEVSQVVSKIEVIRRAVFEEKVIR